MPNTSILETMSPPLQKVVDRARREPQGRFHSLAHLIDVPALMRAYQRQRTSAAVGVDGITKGQYGQDLVGNLEDLHARLKAKRYRHQPIRRVYIPKGQGKTRPIGISAFEDKLVQDAVREVLEAVYEQDFLDCSYGFRPARSAHDAVGALTQSVYQGEVSWILEADIESFFDSLDRTELKKMLETRVADGSLLRLIGKCLHVGVLEGESLSEPDLGTVQGSVLSPLMGNVYLHYVLDLWFEAEVKPRLRGQAKLIRYCDDFIIGFERQDDAHRVQAVLGKRMERFGLTLHPDKTRLLPFWRPSPRQQNGKGSATFDFLGFVRHEVAYTAVMAPKGGHNLVCCHQYPTQTCGWSNPAV
jgi:group II intron reverse transcriptase/maturase